MNTFLMRNDNDGMVFAELLENFNELTEAPNIDTSFRFVEDHEFGVARKHGGNFDAFEFAARKRIIDFALEIFFAKTDSREQLFVVSLLVF